MQQIDSDLWVSDAPLRFVGLEVGARMTVVRLPDDQLLLHSPVAPTPDLVRDVKELGQVTYLVAPNRFHHLGHNNIFLRPPKIVLEYQAPTEFRQSPG